MSSQLPINVRVIRNFTIEPIVPLVEKEFRSRGLAPSIRVGGFSEAYAEVASLAGNASDDDNALVVLALSLEQFSTSFGHHDWQCDTACEHVYELVERAVTGTNSTIVINTAVPPLLPLHGFASVPAQIDHMSRIESLNLKLRALAADNAGRVVLVDWMAYARELGEAGTYDKRFWFTSGLPYSQKFLRRFARDLSMIAEVVVGRVRKCIVLDCDNTLWGGVIGEDGIHSIKLSDNTIPGAYYQEFQRCILDLHSRGVLVALCSKNNENDVFQVLEQHPHCLIRREHLAAWRINWKDKAESLVELASELNIGVDSLVFVDDSAVECERVRDACPDVLVLQTPGESVDLPGFLRGQMPFPTLAVTEMDERRANSYREGKVRNELKAAVASLDEFKARLGTWIRPHRIEATNVQRVAQLFQRTNQFNLNGRRHDAIFVERLLTDTSTLAYCAEIGDKFGDLGLVVIGIVRRSGEEHVVESLLVSCRALGRDVEFAFLRSMLAEASDRWGAPARVRMDYTPTAKNGMLVEFMQRAGFTLGNSGGDDMPYWGKYPELMAENERNFIEIKEL